MRTITILLLLLAPAPALADVCAWTSHHTPDPIHGLPGDSCGVNLAGVIWIPEQGLEPGLALYEDESEEAAEWSACWVTPSGGILCLVADPYER